MQVRKEVFNTKKVLAITMAIMTAAIVIMPVLGYTAVTAGDRSFSVTTEGNQSYTASSTGGQSYTIQSAGNVSNTAASAGRADYSISTGVAAHNLTPDAVKEVNSLTTLPMGGMRVPYSIKYGSKSNYSIRQGSVVPYTIKQGSIVPYTIKQGSVALHSVKLLDVNNTVRDAYQKVKMEPRKLGSIASKEAVVSEPAVVAEETTVVEEVALNETATPVETVAMNQTALLNETALNETASSNETALTEEKAAGATIMGTARTAAATAEAAVIGTVEAEAVSEPAAVETATAEAAQIEAVEAQAVPFEIVTAEPAPTGAAEAAAPLKSETEKPEQAEADMGYTIEGVVFEDLNGNGMKNDTEQGLANWTVNLEQPEGVVIKSANTTSDGKFIFLNQLPGEYTLKEVLQPGWILVSPAEGKLTVVVINQSVTNLGFANKRS